MKRVLITGISGQIGTNLAYNLQDKGYEVFGIDKRQNTWTNDFQYVLQDLSMPYKSFENGIGNIDYGQVDLVVHLAANAKVHELVEHPERSVDNFMMTFNVLEYCRQNNIPMIFSSTREVYGDIKRYETDESQADFATTESRTLRVKFRVKLSFTLILVVIISIIWCSVSVMFTVVLIMTSNVWNVSFHFSLRRSKMVSQLLFSVKIKS